MREAEPTCTRRFSIDAGHRVTQHESKCRNVHGHRYTIEVTCSAPLDDMGRVIDFGLVKKLVGDWLDESLDHGYIHHADDVVGHALNEQGHKTYAMPRHLGEPTAENLSTLVAIKAQQLLGERLQVSHVRVYETPNCWADWRP